MGMESYFFTILINSALTEDEMKVFFRQHYNVRPYSMPSGKFFKRRIIDAKRFVIDDKAVVEIFTSDNNVNITFELCFSNYNNNVAYIFNVLKNIFLLKNNTYLILLNDKYDFNSLDFNMFKQVLQKSHKEKLSIFNKIWNLKQ